MKLISYCCIGISLLLLIIYSLKKYSNFINIREIFKGYSRIFQNDIFSLIVFFIIPAGFAGGFELLGNIDVQKLDNVNLILSILLSMLLTIWGTISNYKTNEETHKEVLIETNNAILFETVMSIILLIFNFTYMFIYNTNKSIYIITILSTIIYYFLCLVMLNLFVVIKRIHKLFIKEIS